DQRSVEGYADVFTPDGVLEHIGGQATGREEILKRAQYLLDSGRAHPNLRHFVGLPAIRGDQERAFASTYCAILELEDAVIRLPRLGRYEDELEKVDGRWRIKHRKTHADLDVRA